MKMVTRQTVIYSPESPLRNPSLMLHEMMRDFKASVRLARQMILRDIAAQYRQSAFGYLWAILPTVATASIWTFLNYSQIMRVQNTGVPYPVYAMTGIVFWQLFVDALNAPFAQLGANRNMLVRVNFPKEALIMSGLGQVMFGFLIKMCVLCGVLLAFHAPIRPTCLFLVFPVITLLLLGTLAAVLLVPLGGLYGDVQHIISVVVTPLMFITPVIYPVPAQGILSALMKINPLTPVFSTVREFLHGNVRSDDVILLGLITVCVGIMSVLAWAVYRIALPFLVERMDA